MNANVMDFDELFTQLFLTNQEQRVVINKVTIAVTINKCPKGFSVFVQNNSQGIGLGCESIGKVKEHIRDRYYWITKKELPELQPAPVRPWFIHITRYGLYPFCLSDSRPDIDSYKVKDEVGDEFYEFEPCGITHPMLDFPVVDGKMLIPRLAILHHHKVSSVPPDGYKDSMHKHLLDTVE